MAKSKNEGLEPLSDAVVKRAKSEAEQILAEAAHTAETMRSEPDKQAQEVRREILAPAKREEAKIRQQGTVGAKLRVQALRLQRREDLLEKVFEAAKSRIVGIQQWSDYRSIVRNLVVEGLKGLNLEAALIDADEQAYALLERSLLKEISDSMGIDLELGLALENKTGVIVKTRNGHRFFDNTLGARLERKMDEMRGPVYRLLTGEGRG